MAKQAVPPQGAPLPPSRPRGKRRHRDEAHEADCAAAATLKRLASCGGDSDEGSTGARVVPLSAQRGPVPRCQHVLVRPAPPSVLITRAVAAAAPDADSCAGQQQGQSAAAVGAPLAGTPTATELEQLALLLVVDLLAGGSALTTVLGALQRACSDDLAPGTPA